jgi:hypothetical protein
MDIKIILGGVMAYGDKVTAKDRSIPNEFRPIPAPSKPPP